MIIPYQAVIFDLDGTLRETEPRFMDALHDCLRAFGAATEGLDWRLLERWVHHYWAQSSDLVRDFEHGGRDGLWHSFLGRLMQQAGLQDPAPETAEAFAQHLDASYRPTSLLMPGALDLLAALRAAGLTLGVVSNRQNTFIVELEALGIASYFDFTLAAGEIGVWKPRPEIFHEALTRAGGIAPTAALYVGDNYYADVVGANNAGIEAILLDDRRIFTDMTCPRIEHLGELPAMLGHSTLPAPQ